MFLLNPDQGLSRDEELQKIWQGRLTPAQRAKVLRIAAAHGCTWLELLREYDEVHARLWADPIERARLIEEVRWQEQPFGPDPLQGTDGDSWHAKGA